MERVLDNRDASWRRLGDFILRETETFDFEAPLGIPLSGFRHEYEWYVREDVVVRSPVRFDGVEIDEETRQKYETDWLRERIAADAELIGDDQAAVTLNTGAILEELGGVEVVGFGAAVAHTRDLFVMLETDRLTATEVGRALRRPRASLVDRIALADTDELEGFVERTAEAQTAGVADDTDNTVLLDSARLEPRFISEAYFMEFTFEPGN